MGKLIVIEGLDGSGKETQSKLIYKKLCENGYKVMMISYPRYEKESSALVKMYLRGDFGKNPDEISPYVSSTFYAADRYASYKCEFEDFYNEGGIIIADRYTTSNMVHQGGKIRDEEEFNKYLDWLWNLEFKLYKIPMPDKIYFLNIPLKYSIDRIEKRLNKITNEEKKDIHENNYNHLNNAYKNARRLIDLYHWHEIDCMNADELKTIEGINEEIYKDIVDNIIKDEVTNV